MKFFSRGLSIFLSNYLVFRPVRGAMFIVREPYSQAFLFAGLAPAVTLLVESPSILIQFAFHGDEFPDVAIQVLKPMCIHKTMVLWFIVGCSAGGHCLAN